MPSFPPETVAFVTGAASGIGLAVASQLAKNHVHKIAILDISSESLASAATTIKEVNEKVEVLTLAVDCSSEKEVDDAVAKTVQEFGRIDVAFNGAGIGMTMEKTEDMDLSRLDHVLGINLKGVWLCERAVVRQLLKQEERPVSTGLPLQTRGSIVNAGSIASYLAVPGLAPYVMAKHGVLGLTKTDAADYGKAGIRVNCVCPGWIKTPMTKKAWENEATSQVVVNRPPLKRWGMPEEVAFTVCFLLSDEASYITGTAIDVDGGLMAC